MLLSRSYTLALAVLSPIVSASAVVQERASCLTCGGCAFQLKASGTGISYIDGAFASLSNFAGTSPAFYFAAWSSVAGTKFKLDSSCRLVAQSPAGTAQVFKGANNQNHALYFASVGRVIGGNTLVPVTCAISTASATLNQLTCTKAGSATGLSFYESRNTVENGNYEIGQELLTDWKRSDVTSTGYHTIKLTAIQA